MTVYRDPERRGPMEEQAAGVAIDADDLRGFALVTETRRVRLPAGPAVVRFEGVAGNILPESAIVTGLASGVVEKNLDADLLSPRTLYDRMLGRRVLIRRTDKRTGRVVTEQATIRSSARGAGVLQLRTGHEALECSGLNERIVYPEVPAGLSAKPTLSIRVNSPAATDATLTLSYLAGAFDWRADYVLTMRGDGRADLFGWVTLASGDVTSFPDAEVAAVAGRLNRVEGGQEDLDERYEDADHLSIRCWPTGAPYGRVPPPPPPPPAEVAFRHAELGGAADCEGCEEIIVTGSRIARLERLGDVKLYRFPDRVTVASRSQKQVALLDKPRVPVQVVYRTDAWGDSAGALLLVLRFRNRETDGLGLPLPAGQVSVFQDTDARPVLLGEAGLADKAVGEDAELTLEPGPAVSVSLDDLDDDRTPDRIDRYRLTVANANPHPIRYEARLGVDDDERLRSRTRLAEDDGRWVWTAVVLANSRASLLYEVVAAD